MQAEVLNTNYATVTYHPEKKLLILVWHGAPTHEQYKNTFITMLDHGKKHPVDSMLTDITNQGIINPENRKWFEREMSPKGVEAGLKRVAVVTPGNAFKMYYINLVLSAVKKLPLETKVFSTQQDALNWLDSFSADAK